MKILQICNKAPYPANDGSSIAICSLAEGLSDNNVELHLLTINTKKHFKSDDQIPESFKVKTNYQSIYQNTDTTIVGAIKNLFSSQSYFVCRFYFDEFKSSLIKKLKTHQFDFVIIDGVFMASYMDFIKANSNAKIILRTHNVEHQIWERHIPNEKNGVKKWYLNLQNKRLKRFELKAFFNADAIVPITDEDSQNIKKLYPTKPLFTCNTGINLVDYQTVSNAKQNNTVFHFASMDWMPNIEAVDWLLESVWNKVVVKMPDAKLIVAGRGMPDKFKASASSNIIVIDSVASSKEFYQTYDIMLVPLWSGSGLRIKLVEGLAYGKPIITTTIGAEGIAYTNNENLLVADNADDFAKAIIEVLQNANLKQTLQNKARLLAETNFDYKVIAKKLIAFCENLV